MVYKVTLQPTNTSNYFEAGHRIRLDVSSSNFPRFDRIMNAGRKNYNESIARRSAQRGNGTGDADGLVKRTFLIDHLRGVSKATAFLRHNLHYRNTMVLKLSGETPEFESLER